MLRLSANKDVRARLGQAKTAVAQPAQEVAKSQILRNFQQSPDLPGTGHMRLQVTAAEPSTQERRH